MPIGFSNHIEVGVSRMPETLQRTLRRLAENVSQRGSLGLVTPSAREISPHTASMLSARKVIKVQHNQGRDRLNLTDIGDEIAGYVAGHRKGGAS